jgi:hypothetical protein
MQVSKLQDRTARIDVPARSIPAGSFGKRRAEKVNAS